MSCIEKIYSVSALVGNDRCNGGCSFCAARTLRTHPRNDANYYKNLEAAIKLSARYGGWSLSLTSAGEPTCDPDAVTLALRVYDKCAKQGAFFPNVNLFTNGILLASPVFCEKYLPAWRALGLGNVCVSVHSLNMIKQARAYGVPTYPSLGVIFANIRKNNLGARCTLLLQRGLVDSVGCHAHAVDVLTDMGIDNITSWVVGNPDATRNKFTPSRYQLFMIRRWLRTHAKLCHGHAWGGGVYDYHGNILRITDYVTKHNHRKDFVRQLVVFQDGTVAYSWIKEGALCMK